MKQYHHLHYNIMKNGIWNIHKENLWSTKKFVILCVNKCARIRVWVCVRNESMGYTAVVVPFLCGFFLHFTELFHPSTMHRCAYVAIPSNHSQFKYIITNNGNVLSSKFIMSGTHTNTVTHNPVFECVCCIALARFFGFIYYFPYANCMSSQKSYNIVEIN